MPASPRLRPLLLTLLAAALPALAQRWVWELPLFPPAETNPDGSPARTARALWPSAVSGAAPAPALPVPPEDLALPIDEVD